MPDPHAATTPHDARATDTTEGAPFVAELLAELRTAGYRPRAWRRFFARSWQRSRATAHEHPRLVGHWAATSATVAIAALSALAVERRAGHAASARRALPGIALGLAAQSADVYLHLGLNARARDGEVYETLGGGTALTMARQAIAALVWGHLLSGASLTRPALAAMLAAAGATDIADGAIARRTDHTTLLGAYLDGVADLNLSLALALALRRQRMLPSWFLAVLAGRWLLPFGGALFQYFARARPMALRSSRLGKAAGVAQHVALGLALVPDDGAGSVTRVRRMSQAIAAACLLAAPLAQLRTLSRQGVH